jgi:predicted Zn-dependent protease
MPSARAVGFGLVGALVVAACGRWSARPEPPAYDPTSLSRGVVARWPDGARIVIYVDTTATHGLDLAGAVQSATRAWTTAASTATVSFRTTRVVSDADIIVHVAAAPRLVGTAGCPTPPSFASGVTFWCPASDSARTLPFVDGASSRVKMDVSVNPAVVNASTSLVALVTHELGHAIGLSGHSLDAHDVMFATPTISVPTARDVITVRWLVRQPVGLRL